MVSEHLTAYLEKIYGMICDNLKKEISPFLNLCIQVGILYKHYTEMNFTFLTKTTYLAPNYNNTFKNAIHRQPKSIRAKSIRGSSKNIHSNIYAKQQASNIH